MNVVISNVVKDLHLKMAVTGKVVSAITGGISSDQASDTSWNYHQISGQKLFRGFHKLLSESHLG